jgi:hypothetical protein
MLQSGKQAGMVEYVDKNTSNDNNELPEVHNNINKVLQLPTD